ncbi:MAG: hypothetical protein IJ321_01520 [Alistipes sp.]|uniref:MAE_28990/MAE_18760 family HEPN-like nuclease n=1 Tax=Alistipes sp. TaxID=1872444 RepID=UPI0023F3FD33|nr:MAE_28990/MAE_18760 family HEPN-like nuclease [Alistipes sp.]MBQ7892602.1 hypothetical protein [Alistipes sp.]
MKIRCKSELQDSIDSEYTWRFHEIVCMKTEIQSMNDSNKRLYPMIRSLVMLSYSHWEGFVKHVTKYFLDYLSRLGLDQSQTHPALVASSLNYALNNKSRTESNRLIYEILTDKHYKLHYQSEAMCDTKSNLNFEVLEVISTNIGIDISGLSLKEKQIDEIMLGRRNKIAHGENDSLDKEYGIEVADISISMMTEFKTLLQNMIATESFKQR